MTFLQSIFKYEMYVKRCKGFDFFNYEELTRFDFTPPKHFNSVFLYGNLKAVSKLTEKKFNIFTDYLEHGVCFSDATDSARLMGYADRPIIKNIYTYSNFRKILIDKYLQENNLNGRNVIPIGPYILGAKNFYNQTKLLDLKREYGKILLVYPSHSIENRFAHYDVENLVSVINQHKKDFDSVFMCLYWKDIIEKKKIIDKYKNEGFIIVCNGHRSDPYFLSRQKDLIMLSDMMLTNGLGTHIGYSVCMNKPVYFIKQEKKVLDKSGNKVCGNTAYENIESSFQKIFGSYSFNISKEQVSLVQEYWGEWSERK